MKRFLFFTFLITLAISSQTISKQKVYVSVLQTRNYVVGANNAPSGLYRYESDTLWTHLGWKNVRNFGVAADPNNEDIIFLACGNGALRTKDAGKTWKITTDWQVTEVNPAVNE